MLSGLQEDVAAIIVGLDEAEGFALAGGAALILRGEVRRTTRDLDFFGLTAEAVDALVPAVERALNAEGLDVRRIRTASGFARLLVERGEDVTESRQAKRSERPAVSHLPEQASHRNQRV